jgi:hypothetical protein
MIERRLLAAGTYLAGLLILWGVAQLGWFAGLDDWFHDRLMRAQRLLASSGSSPVLLVEVDARAAAANPDVWHGLIAAISAQGPRLIGLADPPLEILDRLASAPADVAVLSGGSLTPLDATAARYRWWPPSSASGRDGDATGDATEDAESPPVFAAGIASPRLEAGIARTAPVAYATELGEVPSLVYAMAAALVPNERLPAATFGVDFGRAGSYLPRIGHQRVVDEGLPGALVADRAVLIAPVDPAAVGVMTPIGGAPISAAHYHAFALQTLLEGRAIRPLGAWWSLAGVLLLGVAGWLAFLAVSVRASVWLWFALQLGWLLLAFGVLVFARAWLAVAAPLLGLGWVFALTLVQRLRRQDERLRQLVLEGAAQLDRHRLPEDFLAGSEHWAQIASLASQLLDLKRSIFLARVPGDHRVREVQALNCRFEEIEERRRDYQRTPYSDAIKTNGPIRLGERYLSPRPGEETYMVPLLLGGEVLGFWAFGVATVTGFAQSRLLHAAEVLGRELAELLDRRERWQQQQLLQGRLWLRLLRGEATRSTPALLETTLERLGRRLAVMETVLNGIDSAAILYDLFGRVVQVNQRMEETLRAQELVAYDLTALDFLARLSGVPLDQARAQLRRLIFEREPLSQTVKMPATGGTYLLRTCPLLALEEDRSQPFELLGILLELIDLREAQEVFALKEELIDYLGVQYRDALQVVKLSNGLLANPALDAAHRDGLMQAVNDKLNEIVAFSESVHGFLARDLASVPTDQFPLSPLRLIEAALLEVEGLCQARQIRLHTHFPRVIGMVRGSPKPVMRLLRALLRVMIDDCAEDGELRLELNVGDDKMALHVKNTGFGLPNERLQSYLHGEEELNSEDLRRLREAAALLVQWGGRLSLQGEVGEGLTAALELERFR